MKNLWRIRAYVDLFAGSGRCVDEDTGDEFDGSALRALARSFTHLAFNDVNENLIGALRKRQERLFPGAPVAYSALHCDDAAGQIAQELPDGALTLAFIDPWAYEISFDGLASLASRSSTDLIVTFHAAGMRRNVDRESIIDDFLDDKSWRETHQKNPVDVSNPLTALLIDTYRRRLEERLAYTQFGEPAIIGNTFYLLFASRHPRGLDFWEKSIAKLPSGQRRML